MKKISFFVTIGLVLFAACSDSGNGGGTQSLAGGVETIDDLPSSNSGGVETIDDLPSSNSGGAETIGDLSSSSSEGRLCGTVAYDPESQFCDINEVTRVANIYRYVTIGTQTWMAENLNERINLISWCSAMGVGNCELYGYLYSYDVTVWAWTNNINVCPQGWHLPTKVEWETLFAAVGGQSTAGAKLKAQTGWISYSGITNEDAYGFSALPVGRRHNDTENYDPYGYGAYFWCASENGDYDTYNVHLAYDSDAAYVEYDGGSAGQIAKARADALSVRCVKNSD